MGPAYKLCTPPVAVNVDDGLLGEGGVGEGEGEEEEDGGEQAHLPPLLQVRLHPAHVRCTVQHEVDKMSLELSELFRSRKLKYFYSACTTSNA